MRPGRYRKAIASLIGGLVPFLALFWPEARAVLSEEVILAASGVLAGVFAYAAPKNDD